MADFSIMDMDTSSTDTIALTPYYIDFNIDRIVKEINAYWREDVSALYRYFPFDERGQEYRKAIYGDICKAGVFEMLMEFREGMKQRKKIIADKKLTRVSLQQSVMTISEINSYCNAVETLTQKLATVQLDSEGMNTLKSLLEEYVAGSDFIQLKEQAMELAGVLSSISIKLNYQDHFLYVSFEKVEGSYDAFLKQFATSETGENEEGGFLQRKNPLGEAVEITALEKEIFEIVHRKYPDVFGRLNRFVEKNAQYAKDFIVQLADELAFYLSFYRFAQEMEARGLYFTTAEKSEENKLVAEELYDLALGCQLSRDGKLPVANDARLEENENFFVLTGPNQGGKTTFARSLGQLIFFSKLGLPVPARHAEIPFYTRILTHFSVEESVETGKGKLAEELSRLAPMMEDRTQKNAFVVINELFTTAANYDACIMGKRVLNHFIEQNCHGIYVTHLQDLSKEDPGVVSLRAMMNEEHRQNFKIVRSTAPALESSILLVEKHKLKYEQVKNRLKGEV